MFDEALEVFETMVKNKSEQWLYDNYIPAPGTYVLLNIEDNFSVRNIFNIGKPDEKTEEISGVTNRDYGFVSFLDKNSKLITMNKALDIDFKKEKGKIIYSGKIIHSNNFYSFFVKKESVVTKKLDNKTIDRYYDILANPYLKHKKNAKQIYGEVEKKLGTIEIEVLDKIRSWVKDELSNFLKSNLDKLSLETKEYLKFFFVYANDEKTKDEIKREGERYLLPNIFNNNDYNLNVYNDIYGLHSNNMGLNDKKPFLYNKTRKESIPCAVTMKRAMLQYQFMEYLSSQAAKRNYNVYIDLDKKNSNKERIKCIKDADVVGNIESGLYFRIRQGKTELEIHSVERITQYNSNLKDTFRMKEIFALSDTEQEKYSQFYGAKHRLYEIEMLVNEGFFHKYLISNYRTSAKDLPINMDNLVKEELLLCRDQLWKWFHDNEKQNVGIVLNKACKRLIRANIENNYNGKAKHQFNLWFSLMDYLNGNRRNEEHMSDVREQLIKHVNTEGEWKFESDDEYYYAVGQISRYILDKSKALKKNKNLDMLRPIFSVRNDKILKERIALLAKKYAYEIEMRYVRTTELLAKVLTYTPTDKVSDVMIMAGYVDKNILYSKKESNKETDVEDNNTEL